MNGVFINPEAEATKRTKLDKIELSSVHGRRKSFNTKSGMPSVWMQSKVPSKADIPKTFYKAVYALAMSCGKLTVKAKSKRKMSSVMEGKSVNQASKNEGSSIGLFSQAKIDQKILQDEIESWELSQSMLEDAMVYYHSVYGNSSTHVPDSLLNSKEYLFQDPVEVAKSFDIFDMTKEDIPICWIARLGLCLPLPPEYAEIESPQGKVYLHKLKLVRLQMHPGLLYIRDMVRRARPFIPGGENFENSPNRFQQFMNPNRKLQRVDMLLMRLALEGNEDTYKHYVNKITIKTDKKVSDLVNDQTNGLEGEGVPGKSKLTDFMVLDVCKQVGVNYITEPHLAGFVTSFMLEKEATDAEWQWRSPEHLKFFWVNTIIKRAQSEYPFLEELIAKLMLHKEELRTQLDRPDNFRDSLGLQYIFKKNQDVYVKEKLSEKKADYMNRVIIRRAKDLNTIKELRKKDHLNAIASPTSPKRRSSRGSRSKEGSNLSKEADLPESPGMKSSKTGLASPLRSVKNFATDFLLRKEELSKANKENEKDKATRSIIKEIYGILGEDIIVNLLNLG